MNKNPTITFLKVASQEAKINTICSLIQHFFDQFKKILILVPNIEAALYLDELLWRYPEVSFLPHCITNEKSLNPILITTTINNLNEASVLLNLTTEAQLPFISEFDFVYELQDETHSQKLLAAKNRQEVYQASNYKIQII